METILFVVPLIVQEGSTSGQTDFALQDDRLQSYYVPSKSPYIQYKSMPFSLTCFGHIRKHVTPNLSTMSLT